MNRVTVAGVILLLLAGGPAFAATIHAGNHVLFEDMADQTVEVRVTGGTPLEQTAGMNFRVQIGDGGPELDGSIDGPAITGGDLVTGTIFAADAAAAGAPLAPQYFEGSAALPVGTVGADGLLATVTISTEGFFASDNNNPWELKVTDLVPGAGETELLDDSINPQPIALNFVNGTITLAPVPEPATIVMLLGMLAAVPVVFLRGKRKNRAK